MNVYFETLAVTATKLKYDYSFTSLGGRCALSKFNDLFAKSTPKKGLCHKTITNKMAVLMISFYWNLIFR